MTPNEKSALQNSFGLKSTPKNIERVAKVVGPELSRWAFGQWELRSKAKTKFEGADDMLFTRHGLEMATDQVVARFHASLFPAGELVADLTCGLGGDTLALARRGPVIAFETDQVSADYCRHNLHIHGLEADVRNVPADIEQLLKDGVRWFFLDPARRNESGRLVRIEDYQPNPLDLIGHLQQASLAALKLSPMLSFEQLHRVSHDLSFLSRRWECCEALAKVGAQARSNRKAVQVETGLEIEQRTYATYRQDEPLTYVYEADPAAIKAHVLGAFNSGEFQMLGLGSSYGYLTSDELKPTPWLRGFKTVWSGSFRLSGIQTALSEHGAGIESVKVRGVEVDPIKTRKALGDAGPHKLTLLVYPCEKRTLAVLAERIQTGTP